MKAQVGPSSKELTSEEEAKKYLSKEEVVIVGKKLHIIFSNGILNHTFFHRIF